MIQMLFGNWRRRLATLLVCIVAFGISLIAALSVGLMRSPTSLESVKQFPFVGKFAVAFVEWRVGPLERTASPEEKAEIPSFRQIAPLSAEEITQLIEGLKTQRQVYLDKLAGIEQTEKRLDIYRKEQATEREQIQVLKDQIAKQWTQIDKAAQSLNRQVTELRETEAKNLKQIAATYEAMKPDRAALIVAKLNDTTATKTLYLMRERAAAKILEQMDHDKAAELTQRIMLLKRTQN